MASQIGNANVKKSCEEVQQKAENLSGGLMGKSVLTQTRRLSFRVRVPFRGQ